MYGIYSAKTLENLAKTAHALHNRQTLYEGLFAGQISAAYEAYLQMRGHVEFSIMQLMLCYIYK